MHIELTKEQQQALRECKAVLLNIAELGGDLVLLRAEQYENLRHRVEDDEEKAAWAKLARKTVNRWAEENPF
jgi:hypothetical protein